MVVVAFVKRLVEYTSECVYGNNYSVLIMLGLIFVHRSLGELIAVKMKKTPVKEMGQCLP